MIMLFYRLSNPNIYAISRIYKVEYNPLFARVLSRTFSFHVANGYGTPYSTDDECMNGSTVIGFNLPAEDVRKLEKELQSQVEVIFPPNSMQKVE